MDINEIAERSAASTFLEGFMVDNGDTQTVDKDAWKASLQEDENIRKLAVGAIIVSEMRDAVLKETQFTCSAGIAHNKVRQILQHPTVDSFFILLLLSNLWTGFKVEQREKDNPWTKQAKCGPAENLGQDSL